MRDRITGGLRSPVFATLLLLMSWLLIALGVWGSWVWAEPAGLRILGLDFAEYVKFVAEVQSGQIALVREVFYLPLVVLSISLSLLAHRRELEVPVAFRWLLNLLAAPVALAMLPPAWTPPLLTTPEFLKQTIAIVTCLIAALLSYPLLRRLPGLPVAVSVTVLAGLAAALSISAFAACDQRSTRFSAIPSSLVPACGNWPWAACCSVSPYSSYCFRSAAPRPCLLLCKSADTGLRSFSWVVNWLREAVRPGLLDSHSVLLLQVISGYRA